MDTTAFRLFVDFRTLLPLNDCFEGENVFNTKIDESSVTSNLFIMKYLLYTDGSCDNLSAYREGGYAYVILDQKKNIIKSFAKGTLNTTNNIMELMAIIEGCKAIPEDNAEVVICSDSQYALNVLSGKWTAHVNRALIDEHKINKKRLRLQYNWIKGHCGNKFNDMADLLAETELNNMRIKHGIDVVGSHQKYKRSYSRYNRWK